MERERKIIWAPRASEDLKEGFDFIAVDNTSAAQAWVSKVFAGVEKLAVFSNLGRMIPEIGQSRYRELTIGDYRIFHEVREKEILVFRIFHSKRQFK